LGKSGGGMLTGGSGHHAVSRQDFDPTSSIVDALSG
jgi:hypothetical protein